MKKKFVVKCKDCGKIIKVPKDSEWYLFELCKECLKIYEPEKSRD